MEMSIDEAIRRIDCHNYIHQLKEPRAIYITEAFDTLIEIAKKYQKIQEIIGDWEKSEEEDDPINIIDNIEEVLEDGNKFIL